MQTAPVTAARYIGIFPGRAEQVCLVRRAVARHLTGCPAADDMTLIVSEMAANAVMHSGSRGQFFTVRVELHPDHARVEVEDLGGPWRGRHSDDRPHGLDVVEAFTGADGWGIETLADGGRVVWARLHLV